MADPIDLLAIQTGMVVAPAGCGKTQLLADTLARHSGLLPILVLTHTNAGVVALKHRLDRVGVDHKNYRLSTIDGWAIRLISTFPGRSGHNTAILMGTRPNYPQIRRHAAILVRDRHIDDVLTSSYSRLLVDEYQDCSSFQNALVRMAARCLPTCIVGDHMQAIFGFDRNDPLPSWQEKVCAHFPLVGELQTPWRWIRANAEELGRWLLDARNKLENGQPIDLRTAPAAVTWVPLNGDGSDYERQLQAARTRLGNEGSVLILADSRNPAGQRRLAAQTPGAVTVEAVDLRDFVEFSQSLDLEDGQALSRTLAFAEAVMTNVGAADILRRIDSIRRGTARNPPNEVEQAAMAFEIERTYDTLANVLVELNKMAGVRVFRPSVLNSCLRALRNCANSPDLSFYNAAVQMREQNRLMGRRLPGRAVGSTLLLKGLEAEVAVILNADELSAKDLYVAITRGCQQLVICSRRPTLKGSG